MEVMSSLLVPVSEGNYVFVVGDCNDQGFNGSDAENGGCFQ